ncbi:MAG: group III truncated hemoglobin [Acidobacteriota bacterium]|nr:group III truncated hemoglobin [Acidobacteriota bacterium]
MTDKKDIETRADIDDLMNRFYARAMTDETIGYIFQIAKLDLKHHLPIIGDFWETLLFGTGNYQKHEQTIYSRTIIWRARCERLNTFCLPIPSNETNSPSRVRCRCIGV